MEEPFALRASRRLLLVGIAMLPLQWSVVGAFGHGLLPADLLFALAIGMRGIAWLGRGAPLRVTGFHGWVLAYVLALGASCLVSANPVSSVGKWVGVVYLALLGCLVFDLAGEMRFVRRLVLVWMFAAAVTAVFSVVAIIGFYATPGQAWLQPLLSHYGSLPAGPYPRVRSVFANANMLCNYLTVAVCLLLAARSLGWVGRGAAAAMLGLLLVAAVATISPGLGGIALALALWGWWSMREQSPELARGSLFAGSLVAVLVLAGMWVNLAAPLEEPSVRWLIWQDAWQTWLRHPWLGVGVGQDVVGVAYVTPSGVEQRLTDAHNMWLNIAGQAGLLGVAGLLGLCAWLLRAAWQPAMQGDALVAACAIAFVAAFLYQGMAGSFEDARHLWVLMGLLAAAGSEISMRRVASP